MEKLIYFGMRLALSNLKSGALGNDRTYLKFYLRVNSKYAICKTNTQNGDYSYYGIRKYTIIVTKSIFTLQ